MRMLLERGYPRERIISLTGDRWELCADDRHMLRRGVFRPAVARARRGKLISLAEAAGRSVALDGHNVLITMETALHGGRMLLADDDVVRDISGVGRNHRPGPATMQAAELVLRALAEAGAEQVLIYLDQPLPKSGELAADLRQLMASMGLKGEAATAPVPEDHLYDHQGPVASADSVVVDRVDFPLDLTGQVMRIMDPPPIVERLL